MQPIDRVIPEFLDALRSSQAVVLTAPAGAGKTTGIPPAILESGICRGGQIVLLQPRRMAARAAAARMAYNLGQPVGRTVGYKIRFDEKTSHDTRILVVTEGILTRRFLSDPLLEGTACVILDEFHERSLHVDLALAFCRELVAVRDDLRLVVMSATLQTEPIVRFLGNCPLVSGEDRPFDVEIEYDKLADRRLLQEKTAAASRRVLRENRQGDILVFLPGAAEIERTREDLTSKPLPDDAQVLTLYGALSAKEQDRVLRPGSERRVVLSTNIAETSLTVPGVTAVIDSGLCKQLRHDPASGLDRLETIRISKQSAAQRAGRAGRTEPGRVLRLWTLPEQRALAAADQPEIARLDLAGLLLAVIAFHPGDPREFDFFEPPRPAVLESSLRLLVMLGALEEPGFKLTEKGKRLASIPAHPRVAAMLLHAAEMGFMRQGALLAALLGERDILADEPPGSGDSDVLWRMERLEKLEQAGFDARAARRMGLNPAAASAVRRARDQIFRLVTIPAKKARRNATADQLLSLLLSAYPDRLCRRRAANSDEAVMVGGIGVRLARESSVINAELFVAIEAAAGKRGLRSRALVRKASKVTLEMLTDQFPGQLETSQGAIFDEKKKAVVGVRTTAFHGLELNRHLGLPVDPKLISEALAKEAGPRFLDIFRPDKKGLQLRARLYLARRVMPEKSWPDVSDTGLKSWLPDLCRGKSSFAELARIDWNKEMKTRLDQKLQKLLDDEFPTSIRVPTGSKIRIDYTPATEPGGSPILAVRLQEVFGLTETPRIARGQVPLLMQLLSPARRPVQQTTDLQSFWLRTYPEVRKELRARYPKHAWPEDPLPARAIKGTARGKNRKRQIRRD